MVVVRVFIVLCGLLLASTPAAAAETDRMSELVRALREDGVLIDTPYGRGDRDAWAERIRRARADSPHPVYVVLSYAVPGDGLPSKPQKLVRALRNAGTGPGYYVVGDEYGTFVHSSDVPAAPAERALHAGNRVLDGLDESLTSVARAWFEVRLLGSDPPRVKELIAEARANPAYFPVTEAYPDTASPPPVITPVSSATAGVVVLASVLVAGRWLRGRGRRVVSVEPVEVFMLVDLTDAYRMQTRITELSGAIAQSTPSEESAYVRSTRCAEAAARYADSSRPRDRLGVSLLAMAGLDELAGRTPHRPCVFNPLHEADRVISRTVDDVRLERAPCCAACLASVRGGRMAAVLRIPEHDGGEPERFDATDDVWTRTAYGALSENLAEQVISSSFEERRT